MKNHRDRGMHDFYFVFVLSYIAHFLTSNLYSYYCEAIHSLWNICKAHQNTTEKVPHYLTTF